MFPFVNSIDVSKLPHQVTNSKCVD